MLILIFVITLSLAIVFISINEPDSWDFTIGDLGILLILGDIALFIFMGITGYNIHKCKYVIPEQIAMYEEENARIEEKVSSTVAKYMEYEGNVIMEIAPGDDAMSLISLYPDLKSDQLISEEIKVYIENNNKIKELKEKQLNMRAYKWWLYFGH